MTERPYQYEDPPPMCVRIWLEVGHKCEPPRRSPLGRSVTLDWRVWVRGAGGGDISRFVHKVVFRLHPSSFFVYPKRVIQEPPYEIQESGCASIEIPIHVYLKYSNKPKKIRLKYSLKVENRARGSSEKQCVFYDFQNPSEQLWRSLMAGGGEVVGRAANPTAAARLVLCPARRRRRRACPLCAAPPDLRRYLPCGRLSDLTRDEIDHISRLYLSFKRYEESLNALKLPPFSDPIYRVPELPWSLRDSWRQITKSTSQSPTCHASDYSEV